LMVPVLVLELVEGWQWVLPSLTACGHIEFEKAYVHPLYVNY
jgi:hypothetical protein